MTAVAVHCSFCGKPEDEIDKIIAGPGIHICNECVALCNAIIEQAQGEGATA